MRRDRTATLSLGLPDDVLTVSIGPNGNHVIFTAPEAHDDAVVFVAPTGEAGVGRAVVSIDLEAARDWPDPMWSHDGTVAVIAGREGAQMIDVESRGAIDLDRVVGDVQGEIVGFVSIRHEAGITSPAGEAPSSAG